MRVFWAIWYGAWFTVIVVILWFAWNVAHSQTIACGMPPIPAPGCHVGPCICDSEDHCTYLIICR